ncbi:hypothetical protein TKK_0011719 [Trichogramma kaykai]
MQTEYSPPRAIAERLVGSSELDRSVVTKRKTASPLSFLGRATSRFLPPPLKKQTPTIRLKLRHSPHPVESQQSAENMAVKQEPREDGSGGDAEQQQPQQQQLQQLQQPPVFEITPNEIKVELEPQRPETTTRVKSETDSSSSGNQPSEELTTTTTSNSSDLSDNRPQAHVSEQHNESRRPAASRGRRKSRFVLKFHHQALPQEYLDHYEATQAAQEAAALLAASSSPSTPSSSATSPTNMASFPFAAGLGRPGIDEHLALKQLAAMHEAYSNINSNQVPSPTTIVGQQQRVSPPRRSVISCSATAVNRPATPKYSTASQQRQPQQHPQPRPPMRFADLPYMGEITLENSKPRRGRKPKKADICHLIYKNYGQIVPGTPGLVGGQQQQQQQLEPKLQDPVYQRTDVQNRISSLLEKRLTQEQRQAAAQKLRRQQLQLQLLLQQSEPLNLCLRDVEDVSVEVPSDEEEEEPATPSIVVGESSNSSAGGGDEPTIQLPWATRNNHHNNNNSVNNNNDGQFVHPETVAALQSFYQHQQQQQQQRLLLEQRMKLKRAAAPTILQPQAQSAAAAMQMHMQPPPAKRKRSAIFIPPVPPENNNNPATEVSICKFKFTGGDKPSLQEKKSLSVDSGGNFRYYSGTGDKSMRGYEFFPRESLQQVPGGPTPALLKGTNTSPVGTGGITERRIVSAPSSPRDEVAAHRNKRKTRKSLQREKLEQTFKEKGFLIQTQQRDAAEGSTFCKFRRLRKFTRYLYRSWKDHLPDDVRELSAEQARVAAAAAAAAAMASNDNINDQMVVDRMPRQVEQPSAAI